MKRPNCSFPSTRPSLIGKSSCRRSRPISARMSGPSSCSASDTAGGARGARWLIVQLQVHTIAAPEERGNIRSDDLQRFWERLPRHGQIVAFDRSWYGRVLVERVEGFAAAAEWRRAYDEINE